MDTETLHGFWRRLAQTRLHAEHDLPLETILAGLLGVWSTCVVCNVLWEWTFDLLSRWQHALAEDPGARAQFSQSQRWCNEHAWFLKDLASPRTRSRVHRELFTVAEERIGEMLRADLDPVIREAVPRLQVDLMGSGTCPVCDEQAVVLQVVLAELARGLSSGSLREPFAASGGCCLPHLAALLHALPDVGTARFVLDATAAQLRRLREELETYETEAERRTRRYGSAADAPARAMVLWAGMRGVVAGENGQGQAALLPAGRASVAAAGDGDPGAP
jgi:hypothetical protein